MYYVIDYFTDDIIDVFEDIETAIETCERLDGTQVENENGYILLNNAG